MSKLTEGGPKLADHALVFDLSALASIQEAMGVDDLQPALDSLSGGRFDARMLVTMIWAGWLADTPGLTREQASERLRGVPIRDVLPVLAEAIRWAFEGPGGAETQDDDASAEGNGQA